MKGIAVIGANYGDEGKGLMTDYFCNKKQKEGTAVGDIFVVRHNGGSQAGHTVVTPAGSRHVFHHFGSGTFLGAPTVLSKHFILNPILFRKEWDELNSLNPIVYVSDKSMITTPWDMAYNQIVEEARSRSAPAGGAGRHGSCGVGINATVDRHESVPLTWDQMHLIWEVREYYKDKLLSEGVKIPEEYLRLFKDEHVISAFFEDYSFMRSRVSREDPPFKPSSFIVFEGAQGLGLDEYMGQYPRVTRSNTGLRNVVDFCRHYGMGPETDLEEIVYVTRSYLTRHGNGPIEGQEGASFVDKTNVPNPWQGTIRGTLFNDHAIFTLEDRIDRDLCSVGMGHRSAVLAVTHCDQHEFPWAASAVGEIQYRSYGETREDVEHADLP